MILKIITAILVLLLNIPAHLLQDSLFLKNRSNYANKHIYIRTIEPQPEEPFEMLFFGDVMLGRYIATLRGRYSEEDPTFRVYVDDQTGHVAAAQLLERGAVGGGQFGGGRIGGPGVCSQADCAV